MMISSQSRNTILYTTVIVILAFCGINIAVAENVTDIVSRELSYSKQFTSNDGLAHNKVQGICQDRNGFVWICTWYGLERFDGYGFYCFRPQKEQSFYGRLKKAVIADDGRIIVKTAKNKMLAFSLKDYTFCDYHGKYPNSGIPFRNSFKDKAGNLWETENVGFRLTSPRPSNYNYISNTEYPLARVLFEDSSNRLWISWTGLTINGHTEGEVLMYDLACNKIRSVYRGNAVFAIYEDKQKNIWLGTHDNGVMVMKPYGADNFITYSYSPQNTGALCHGKTIFTITGDSQGRIWIGTLGGGLCVVDKGYDVSKLSFISPMKYPLANYSYVRSLLETNGYMLIATDNGLLTAPLDNSVSKLSFSQFISTKHGESLFNDELIHILKTKNNQILISSFGKGICKLDAHTKTICPLYAGDIAERQAVYSMLDNGDDRLWVTFQTGIRLYAKDSSYISPISEPVNVIESLPLRDSRGQCWFATRNGVICIKKVSESSSNDLKVAFVNIDYGNYIRNLAFSDSVITVFPNERNITVNVSALQYGNMNNVRYAWRIVESDTTWTEVDSHSIALPRLEPGTCTLEVRSTDGNGHWLENINILHFRVTYRWYETKTASGMLLFFILMTISLIIWLLLKVKRLQLAVINSQPVVLMQTALTEIKQEDSLTDSDRQFISTLNENILTLHNQPNFSIDILAVSMNMSRSVFYRRLKSVVGQSPTEYLNEWRLQRATELLINSPEKSVQSIAFECGFSSPQYFSNVFRKRYHKTPNEWRKQGNE